MDDDALGELRALRARAYGPAPDIDADPAALARLTALEDRMRREGASRDIEAAAHGRASEAGPTGSAAIGDLFGPPVDAPVETPTEPAEPSTAPLAAESPAAPRGGRFARLRPTRPVALAWAVSLVLTVIVTVAAQSVLAGTRPVATPIGAHQVATIGDGERIDDEQANAWFGTTGGARSYTFRGLTILAIDGRGGDAPQACLTVVATDSVDFQDRTFSGQQYSGCAEGAFPAAAAFTVGELSPAELRAAYPVGTALQFVLVGDEVAVFADDGGGVSAQDD